MSFKYFLPSDVDCIGRIRQLKEEFPGYFYKDGRNKDQTGIWILKTLEKTPYGLPVPSCQFKGCTFYPPQDKPTDIAKFLEAFEKKKHLKEFKMVSTTLAGIRLFIVPATLEPKQIVFSFGDEEAETETNVYSQASEYGRLAFKVSEEIQKTKQVFINKDTSKLIKLALMSSYDLSFDVWNWLGCINEQDMFSLISAALGSDPSLVESELKKNTP